MPYDEAQEEAQEPEYEGLDHSDYLKKWREAVDVYSDPRKQHFEDEAIYDGDVKGTGEGHWSLDELSKLAGRNQPPVVFNLVKNKINAIAGVEQRARSEPRAMPRTPKDQYAAEIATDALRFIKDQTRWESIKADAFLDALKVGFAAIEIGGEEDTVPITPIDWKDFFFDPHSRRPDFSDAQYLGTAKWLDKSVALATYVPPEPPRPQPLPPPQIPPQPLDPAQLPQWAAMAQGIVAQYQAAQAHQANEYRQAMAERQKIIDAIENTVADSGAMAARGDDFEDRPLNAFGDSKRNRIFIIDMWHRDANKGWFRCVFTGQGKLYSEEAEHVEVDAWGRKTKTHPIKAFSLYVSRDLWRYGEVRGLRSPQAEYNARRSKALHLLTLSQFFYEPGALVDGDVEKTRRELATPDGAIAVTGIDKYRIERNIDLARGQQELGAEARAFIEMQGPNPQLQGEQGRATSGRAVLALQQAGLGQLGPIFDRLYDWELRCYRAMWSRVQQYWTAPKYVRVTDDKNAAKFAAVNGAPVLDENGRPKMRQAPAMPQGMGAEMGASGMIGGMAPMQPAMQPQAMFGHNGGPPMGPEDMGESGPMLAELDMDIVVDRAQEAATLQAEQFETLSQLAQAGVLGPPNPETARLIITASALPTKTQLLDMLDKAAQAPQQPDPAQMAQLKELAAKVELLIAQKDKTRAETAKIGAEIPKTQAETAHTQAKARTENVAATMNKVAAPQAPRLGGSDFMFAPPPNDPAAGELPGALGLPPSTANGPPPF